MTLDIPPLLWLLTCVFFSFGILSRPFFGLGTFRSSDAVNGTKVKSGDSWLGEDAWEDGRLGGNGLGRLRTKHTFSRDLHGHVSGGRFFFR